MNIQTFIDVILPLPLGILTYHMPTSYKSDLDIGSGTLVPLRGKVLLAIVVKVHTQPPPYVTKALLGKAYDTPLLTLQQLTFLKEIAHYYVSSLGETLAVALPKPLGISHNIVFKAGTNPPVLSDPHEAILLNTLLHTSHLSYSTIKKLLGKKEANKVLLNLLYSGCIQPSILHSSTHTAMSLNAGPLPPLLSLTDSQQKALTEIKKIFTEKEVVLLYGTIGSGKTILYMHLIQEVLFQKKQILLLLPEIALATHILERIAPFFGLHVVVYHSKQSPKERLKTWFQVHLGHPLIVVGTRSAIFLPFKDLKLIVIDEEHDHAYKHTDSSPTYHARSASILLAQQHQAKVLLGSGTPAIETYYNTQSGKYGLVTLADRFGSAKPPQLFFIDINIDEKRKTLRENFSRILLDEITKNIDKGKQVMIFQNRRGYAQYVLCNDCRWVPHCLSCSVSLTYHQSLNHLVCHYCGYMLLPLLTCPECGSTKLHNMGFGTEKLEETLHLIFHNQKVDRMDLDSSKKQRHYQTILKRVASGEIDILVGTQMIAKGLDFSNIQLVGVLDIDRLLHFPDFRANEKCFQLIAQLAGRAGRRDDQGQVFIQTRQPNHPIFQYIYNHDYQAMYAAELAERKRFGYPPYARIIQLTLSSPTKDILQSGALALKAWLEKEYTDKILGPQQPLVGKIRNLFLLTLLVKIIPKNRSDLIKKKQTLKRLSHHFLSKKMFGSIKILLDVDPM